MEHNRTGEVSGFLRAEGRKLVNGDGREILLRGVGFGSWLLPEGYMWSFPDKGDRPRRIERMIEELIGADQAASFWETYYDRYVSESDIRRIAEEGLNSVRVPINSRFLLEEGEGSPVRYKEKHLALLDRMIGWCRKHRLYVILDLHGAPGGQTGTNIDDSEFDRPELFLDKRNAGLTLELWAMLAARYKDEWIVAGYDLLNEPLPDWFAVYNDRIMPLYKEIVRAIREVDDRHMIILEGAHWSTDWSIFDEKIDHNIMLQFHKYWNNPDTESIQAYLDKRELWDVPIFMGEGGENNKEWYAGAFRLFEDHGISWNFWTWKKLERDNSPCSIRRPEGWNLLVEYLEGGAKPSPEVASTVLTEYLANIAFERCEYDPDVVGALLRRPPVRIPAIFYGYGGAGISYYVSKKREESVGFRDNDGTDIRFVDNRRKIPNFQHGRGEPWLPEERMCVQLATGDWLAYEFDVPDRGELFCNYTVSLRLCAVEGESETGMKIKIDERSCGFVQAGPDWKTVQLPNEIRVSSGLRRLVSTAEGGYVRIEWIELRPSDG
ncbi:cellulase family glycosylhydrolase [Cohnella herbarum]|uniref:Cellulase family glycosylhydrolase n=1 Tax=Cohnella herbarum TaxID=2728023 RepID=A0A7Z2VSJ6_9BACL|nr:cellulase family glycosylhydrolase [Cohnella herbarum]